MDGLRKIISIAPYLKLSIRHRMPFCGGRNNVYPLRLRNRTDSSLPSIDFTAHHLSAGQVDLVTKDDVIKCVLAVLEESSDLVGYSFNYLAMVVRRRDAYNATAVRMAIGKLMNIGIVEQYIPKINYRKRRIAAELDVKDMVRFSCSFHLEREERRELVDLLYDCRGYIA